MAESKQSTQKLVSEYQLHDHGIEHAQYFQGHGLAFSSFTDTATGCGDTMEEAIDDALDQLACNGWNVGLLESAIKHDYRAEIENSDSAIGQVESEFSQEDIDDETEEYRDAIENSELYYYVSIDVKGAADDKAH